jgi:hypothetical protein
MRWYIPFLLTAISASHSVGAQSVTGQLAAIPAADTFAHATQLSGLRDGDGSELRIWVESANLNLGFDGWVANARGIMRCTTEERRSVGGKIVIDRTGTPHCEKPINPQRARRLLELLPQLSLGSFDKCGVLDGYVVVVDGLVNGRRFALKLDNPDACNATFKHIFEIVRQTP